jgi:Zn-dependent protease with chaperone function
MLVKSIKKLYGIDPRSWEHPADKAALSALKQLKGLDELVKNLVSVTTERSLKLMQLGSSVKVSPTQFPKLHNAMANIVDAFDWDYFPTVYVSQSPFFNAGVLGVKEPFIVLNSSLLKTFDDAEIQAVLGHEFGHIMSGHSLYKTLIWLLTNISLRLIPLAEILIYPILAALSEWNRKSELTADRAGLLATQVEKPNYDVLMRMAGGDDLSQVNLNDFFLQAQEYDDQKGWLDSIHKALNQVWLSHPYPVIRLQELKTWASGGYYESILAGNYFKRGYATVDPAADIKEGFDFYKESLAESDDPLSRLASNIGNGIEKAAEDIGTKIKELFNKEST